MRVVFRYCVAVSFSVLFLIVSVGAEDLNRLPIAASDSHFRATNLRESESLELSKALRNCVAKNPEWQALTRQGKMAVGLVDISSPDEPRSAWINGDEMMYAASLPKIAILFAAFQAIEEGRLKQTPEVMADLNQMIRVSSNEAATRTIDRLGGLEAIAKVLSKPEYRFFDEKSGGGLWVGKRYAKTGGVKPDPVNGLLHGASVFQVCRFYYLLAAGKLINQQRSAEMLSVLSRPGLHHKFISYLDKKYPDYRLYRKSGTWQTWHADSVMVWGKDPKHRYILVGLVQSSDGETILRNLVPVVETQVLALN